MPFRRKPLVALFFTVFMDLMGFGMVIPILQLYARDLHATVPQTGISSTGVCSI